MIIAKSLLSLLNKRSNAYNFTNPNSNRSIQNFMDMNDTIQGGDIDKSFEEDLLESLDEINIFYIPSVKDILDDNIVVNVFSDQVLEDSFYDLFHDKKIASMLLDLHKNILTKLRRNQNKIYTVKNKLLFIDGEYKQHDDDDTPLSEQFNNIRKLGWEDYIKNLNQIMFPFEIEQDEEISKEICDDVEIVINNQTKINFYGSLYNTRLPIRNTKIVLKTNLFEPLQSRLLDYEYKVFDSDIIREPDTNDIDELLRFYIRLGIDFDDIDKEFLNTKFKREPEHIVKYDKIDIHNPYINMDYLNFFSNVNIPNTSSEELKQHIQTLSKETIYTNTNIIDLHKLLNDIHTQERTLDEIRNDLREIYKKHSIAQAIQFLQECIETTKMSQDNIDRCKNAMNQIRYEYIADHTFKSSKLKNELKEIIEADDDNVGKQYIKKEMHFEENMDFEMNSGGVDEGFYDIDKYINEYSCYKDYSNALKEVIPTILQLQETMNINVDIGMILKIITMPYINNHSTIDHATIFHYAIAAIYMILEENIVDGRFKEPKWFNENCVSYWDINDVPTKISDDEIRPNGLLNYIVCCVMEITDLMNTDALINTVCNIILKVFNTWYKEILEKSGDREKNKKKKSQLFSKAIEQFIIHPDNSNYVKALLYMPNTRAQKQINKRVQGCCAQKLSSDFKAFSDLVETDTKLKYLKDFMAKKGNKNIAVWKAKAFNKNKEELNDNIKAAEMEYIFTNININKDINEIIERYRDIIDDRTIKQFSDSSNNLKMNNYIDAELKNFETIVKKKNKLFREFFDKNLNVRALLNIIIEIDYIKDMQNIIIRFSALINEVNNIVCSNKINLSDNINTFKQLMAIQLLRIRELHIIRNITDIPAERYSKTFDKYISDNNTLRLAPILFNKIVNYQKTMSMPTEAEYKIYAAKMREEYKIAALNKLDSMDKDERKLMVDLKKWGIHNYMSDINVQKTDKEKDAEYEGEFNYAGDDMNFTEF